MEVRTEMQEGAVALFVSGRVDALTAPDFERAARDAVAGASSLVIDLSDVAYISSAGLRVLLVAYNGMDGRPLAVRHPSEHVMGVLEATGFSNLLPIER